LEIDRGAFLGDVEGVVDRGEGIGQTDHAAIGEDQRIVGVPVCRAELVGEAAEQAEQHERPEPALPRGPRQIFRATRRIGAARRPETARAREENRRIGASPDLPRVAARLP